MFSVKKTFNDSNNAFRIFINQPYIVLFLIFTAKRADFFTHNIIEAAHWETKMLLEKWPHLISAQADALILQGQVSDQSLFLSTACVFSPF